MKHSIVLHWFKQGDSLPEVIAGVSDQGRAALQHVRRGPERLARPVLAAGVALLHLLRRSA